MIRESVFDSKIGKKIFLSPLQTDELLCPASYSMGDSVSFSTGKVTGV
jgi:hypothetical protein